MRKNDGKSETGKLGEKLAFDYLLSLGYQWLDSNYKTRFGEIDLIFKDQNVLVFVEVKTRKGKQLMPIESAINREKINNILKSAEVYIYESGFDFEEMRIDAVFVRIIGKETVIRHCKSYV